MKLNTGPIKDWFGFSRRERRSNFILLIIIIVIIGIRYIVPESTTEVEDITGLISASDTRSGEKVDKQSLKSSGITAYRENPGRNTGIKNIPSSKTRVAYTPKNEYQSQSRQLIDINSSDSTTLVKLPGIGPVLSARIIRYRNFLGGYATTNQLKEVYGLSEETFNLIQDRVTADTSFIKRVNVNTAGYKELAVIHYLEKYEITSILKYRDLQGRINSVSDLSGNKIITPEKSEKVRAYLKFEE